MKRTRRLERRTRLTAKRRFTSRPDARCCGKTTYTSQAAAESAVYRIQQLNHSDKVPQRVYQCAAGAWHLTSKRQSREQWQQVVRQVLERDGWRCARCGAPRDLDPHHRQLKSAGGPDAPDNLITLCRADHDWAHANRIPAEAAGLIVPSWKTPAQVPLQHLLHGWVLLTSDYRTLPVYRTDGAA